MASLVEVIAKTNSLTKAINDLIKYI